MKNDLPPVNISLMTLTPQRLSMLRPVTSLDIFEGRTNNFDPNGLFSTEIFGRIGSEFRDTRFSYIDIKIPVLHPMVFQHLVKLKGLYGGIISGSSYAEWSDSLRDFVTSDISKGETGYYFFMKHWKKILFRTTGSDTRDVRIQFIEKYKDKAETSNILVIPAGIRDLHVSEDGRHKQDEINDIYRSIISVSNTVSQGADYNSNIYDVSRLSLQRHFNRLFDYLKQTVSGKGGFIQSKWASRKVFNTTRNVITAMDSSSAVLGAPNSPKYNQSVLGVYQMAKAALPKTKHALLTGWLGDILDNPSGNVNLVDPKTLKSKMVYLEPAELDKWMTSEGIEKIINSLSEPELRGKPVIIGDHYLALMYYGPDNTFRLIRDIDEVPEEKGRSKQDVHPITLIELVYLSCWKMWHELPAYLSRYPITGEGSIYLTTSYVKTTTKGTMRYQLDEDWEVDKTTVGALEYPEYGGKVYFESLSPGPAFLNQLGADRI